MHTVPEMKRELADLVDAGLALANKGKLSTSEELALVEIETKAAAIYERVKDAEREQKIRGIGRTTGPISFAGGPGDGGSLADALLEAGFERKTHPVAIVDNRH